jgi:hypothetical protein
MSVDAASVIGWGFAVGLVVAGIGLWAGPQLKALVWAGRLPGRLGALPVEHVAYEDAPRGWKCAQILVSPDGGDIRLSGIAIGGAYLAEDIAVCAYNRDHAPPALACECGFYAFRERARAADLLACAVGFGGSTIVRSICEVDLMGTVVECDDGYRAERQRVLGLSLLPWCADCAVRGTLVPADLLAAEPRRSVRTSAFRSYAEQAASRSIHPSVRLRLAAMPMRPICERCAARVSGLGVAAGLVEVAGALGTEVRWLDPDVVPGDRVLAAHRPRPPWGG